MTSERNYEAVLALLRTEVPDLAEQLEQEVRRGRSMTKDELRREGRYEERANRLVEADLAALGANDVAVVPYTDQEGIELLRDALLTLAETMFATRQTVLQATVEYGLAPNLDRSWAFRRSAPELKKGAPTCDDSTCLRLNTQNRKHPSGGQVYVVVPVAES